VQDSPCSSDSQSLTARSRGRHERWHRRAAAWIALIVSCFAGCATVRPEDKEYLAEPSMTWSNSSLAARHEAHVIDNREGSTGGSKTKGGGCGCN
jgi:hypothetical protein